jgi:hypothetical protein
MRSGIKEFQPRQPLDRQLSAATLNQILRELESLRITRVVNGTFRKMPGGTEIVVAPQSGGSPQPTRQPWDLIARKDPDNEDGYLVRVHPGTLNNILADNWSEEFTAQKNTTYFAIATAATDGVAVTGVTIKFQGGGPQVQLPEKYGISNEIDFLFGVFRNSAQRTIGPGNINVAPDRWLLASADPAAAPGESPYDIYYLLK